MKKLIMMLLLLPNLVFAHDHLEKYYQIPECDRIGGTSKIQTKLGTWPDCVTEYIAVEVDFAEKWAESFGQATHYALELNLNPVIWLIIENEGDCKHIPKLMPMADRSHVIVKQLGAYAGKCL